MADNAQIEDVRNAGIATNRPVESGLCRLGLSYASACFEDRYRSWVHVDAAAGRLKTTP